MGMRFAQPVERSTASDIQATTILVAFKADTAGGTYGLGTSYSI